MSIDYTYDEAAAQRADEAASRLEHAQPYVGTFKRAQAIVSAKTGTEGIEFEFEAPGQGSTSFSLYTRKEDGSAVFGANFVNAFMFFFGLRSLKSQEGKGEVWDDDTNKRVEAEVDLFPDLCGKPIGLVFQKELYTNTKGLDSERLNLAVVFQPETRLLMSEIRERKSKPEKLEKAVKSLRVKDQRKKGAAEPAQPGMGAPAGDY